MENFLSSIYIKPNAISDERICVGLFVGGTSKSYFGYSEHKLKILTKLAPNEVVDSLHLTLTNLEKDIKKNISTDDNKIFVSEKYSLEYFKYLNNYNKGLIEFREPTTISKAINSEAEFEKLFKLYVGEGLTLAQANEIRSDLKKIVSNLLKNDVVKENADVKYSVSTDLLETIYRPHKIDFISYNGAILAGNSIDFSLEPNVIERKIFENEALFNGFATLTSKKKFGVGKYIVYFSKPEGMEQIKMHNTLLKKENRVFELKEVEEMENVVNILSVNNYKKFSESNLYS